MGDAGRSYLVNPRRDSVDPAGAVSSRSGGNVPPREGDLDAFQDLPKVVDHLSFE